MACRRGACRRGLAFGQAIAQGTISDLPRKETLIVENPEGTIKNAGWFNIWAINAGSQSTGLHQLAMDTFWYIDPQKGVDGVWDNSLASEKPIYNADFTEMTVKLRKGIFWSDGVEFTADDVRLHHPDPHEDQRPALERAGADQRRRGHARPIRRPSCSSSRSPTRASTRCSRCAGTRCG